MLQTVEIVFTKTGKNGGECDFFKITLENAQISHKSLYTAELGTVGGKTRTSTMMRLELTFTKMTQENVMEDTKQTMASHDIRKPKG